MLTVLVPLPVLAQNVQTCTRCIEAARGDTSSGAIMVCPVDGGQMVAHATTGECPKALLKTSIAPLVQVAVAAGSSSDPVMWAQLHTTIDADEAWLMAWSRRLSCGPCTVGWTAILKELPPVYGAGWFAWTVAAHNAVNRKLGKAEMGFAEALARWVE